MQRGVGLPRVDDPDVVVHLRAGAEAAGMQRFRAPGFDSDQLISAICVLAEGLSRAAEVMRPTAGCSAAFVQLGVGVVGRN